MQPTLGSGTGNSVPRRSLAGSSLEPQQALVLGALREADGAAVSYASLRARGVELPASVVSELELAGVPVQRRPDLHGQLGVSLDPLVAAELLEPGGPASPPRLELEPDPENARPAAGLGRLGVWLGPAALAAVLVAVFVVIGLSSGGGGAGQRRTAAQGRSRPRTTAGRRTSAPSRTIASTSRWERPPRARHTSTTSTTSSSATRAAQPATAASLQLRGHDLLTQGDYTSAIPLLKNAMDDTGESAGACSEPTSEGCLTYAYALYDLGRALELSGDAPEAVTVLKQRLAIDNQRPTVAATLAAAKRAATRSTTTSSPTFAPAPTTATPPQDRTHHPKPAPPPTGGAGLAPGH